VVLLDAGFAAFGEFDVALGEGQGLLAEAELLPLEVEAFDLVDEVDAGDVGRELETLIAGVAGQVVEVVEEEQPQFG
jgi:hypothetical protein